MTDEQEKYLQAMTDKVKRLDARVSKLEGHVEFTFMGYPGRTDLGIDAKYASAALNAQEFRPTQWPTPASDFGLTGDVIHHGKHLRWGPLPFGMMGWSEVVDEEFSAAKALPSAPAEELPHDGKATSWTAPEDDGPMDAKTLDLDALVEVMAKAVMRLKDDDDLQVGDSYKSRKAFAAYRHVAERMVEIWRSRNLESVYGQGNVQHWMIESADEIATRLWATYWTAFDDSLTDDSAPTQAQQRDWLRAVDAALTWLEMNARADA